MREKREVRSASDARARAELPSVKREALFLLWIRLLSITEEDESELFPKELPD